MQCSALMLSSTNQKLSLRLQQQRREREIRKQQEREQRRRYEEMEQLRREEERRHAEREQVGVMSSEGAGLKWLTHLHLIHLSLSLFNASSTKLCFSTFI